MTNKSANILYSPPVTRRKALAAITNAKNDGIKTSSAVVKPNNSADFLTPKKTPIIQKNNESSAPTPPPLRSCDQYRYRSTPRGKATPIREATPVAVVPTTPAQKKAFQYVCEHRIGEDPEGDLVDEGIQEWCTEDFTYIRKLGHGGAATVYLAHEKESGYPVALKRQKESENGLCEVDLHHPLKHDGIVNMIDYFYSYDNFCPDEENEEPSDDDDGSDSQPFYMYMILELCDSGSLHDVIDISPNCALEEPIAAKYMKQAMQALKYLHSQDIIHCDIKPANFLVHQDQVKLADLGMAVRSDEREIVGGSPVYMAPEHLMAWRHFTDNFDHRVDIYSLGVVMYEMLEGFLPYEVLEADKGTLTGQTTPKNHSTEENDLCTEDILNGLKDMTLDDGSESESDFPVLDLRKLNDASSDEPFYIPPPFFMAEISDEAQDLVVQLMELDPNKRISLEDALNHEWFRTMGQ